MARLWEPGMQVRGREVPRLWTPPLRPLTPDTSLGFELCDFAADVLGVDLLPWQRWLAVHALELHPTLPGFRYRKVLVLVGRQNGKTTWAQALSLWRMYVDGARLVLGTAQNLDIAEDVWAGAVEMAQSVDELDAEIEAVRMSTGGKTLVLTGRRRYKVAAANRKAGRSLTVDLLLLDELREHQTWDAWSAASKTTNAVAAGQVVCLSNAGDDRSVVLNHLYAQGLQTLDGGGDERLGLFSWSAPPGADVLDVDAWEQANPSLGWTMAPETIASDAASEPEWVFRTEVLCERVETMSEPPLPGWDDLADPAAKVPPGADLVFGVDTSWDRSTTWIAVAARVGRRIHIEVVASGLGTEWAPHWIADRIGRWKPSAVAWQKSGAPVSSIDAALAAAVGEEMARPLPAEELAKGCGALYDAVSSGVIVHCGQEQLDAAAATAVVKPLGDSWAFDRKNSPADAAPLTAAAAALRALAAAKPSKPPAQIWGA